MQAAIIFLVLSFIGVIYYLMPLLHGRDESSPHTTSDSDDGRFIGTCFDDREKKEGFIEYEVKRNPAKNSDFIKKLILIVIIAVAVFAVFYMSIL